VIAVAVVASAMACGGKVPSGVAISTRTVSPTMAGTSSPPVSPGTAPAGAGWASTLEGQTLSFRSLPRALAFLRKSMPMQIRLPRGLPHDTRLTPMPLYVQTIDGQRSAQLDLLVGATGHLVIQWGVSQLDGCTPEDSAAVLVSGQPGRIRESAGGEWKELIWPATLERPYGTLGLAGSFSRGQILAMARSMTHVSPPSATDVGC
jgi:hypothetical protein